MDTSTIYQIIGYTASVLIALSMMMNSLLRLRIINLAGSATMAVYGALINAYPILVLNCFIVMVNIFYLYGIYRKKEFFSLLQVKPDSRYLKYFLDFHDDGIKSFLPDFAFAPVDEELVFFVLRDTVPAGLMIVEDSATADAWVKLDYVVEHYRDFKVGDFVFCQRAEIFRERGIRRLLSKKGTAPHETYLKRMGFVPVLLENREEVFALDLESLPGGY
jgi:hypothetical protein